MSIVIVALTIVALLTSVRLFGLIPYPTGIIALMVFSQTFLIFYNFGFVDFPMLDLFNFGGTKKNELYTIVIYFCISVFVILSFIGYKKPLESDITKNMISIIRSKYINAYIYGAIFLIIFHLSLVLIYADWSLLWINSAYLSSIYNLNMIDYDPLALGSTAMRAMPHLLIVTTLVVCVCVWLKRWPEAVLSGLLTGFYFLVVLGLHSRAAALTPTIIAAVLFLLRPKFYKPAAAFCLIIVILSMVIALNGRSSPYQGLGALGNDFALLFSKDSNPMAVGQQIAQGAFVLAESLILTPDLPTIYKVLSFSPLPSFIDGYSALLPIQVRLSLYVPMSGVAETIHFGPIYIVTAGMILALAARLNIKISNYNQLLFTLSNFLIMCGIYGSFSYSARTGLRFVWLSIFLSLAIIIFQPKAQAKNAVISKPRWIAFTKRRAQGPNRAPAASRLGTRPNFDCAGHQTTKSSQEIV
jgi:hypothetical protein